jgi:hypothetical protein
MIEEATARLHAEFGRPPRPVDWVLGAWANVNRRGDFNQAHTHPGATWSGDLLCRFGRVGPRRRGHVDPAVRSEPGADQHLLSRTVGFRRLVQAGTGADDPLSELCAACGAAASRRRGAYLDRVQRAPRAIP